MKSSKNEQKTAVNPKHAELFRKYGKKKVSMEQLEEIIKNFPKLTMDAEELRRVAWNGNGND